MSGVQVILVVIQICLVLSNLLCRLRICVSVGGMQQHPLTLVFCDLCEVLSEKLS